MRRLICRFLPVKSVGTSANTQSWSGRPKAVDQRALSTESGAPHIAVIGGGLGGSSAAQSLAKLGSRVSVFDMGFRGPGGRASTRRYDDLRFDHGCQFVLAPKSDWVRELQQAGVLKQWQGRKGLLHAASGVFHPLGGDQQLEPGFCSMTAGREELYVGVPGMDSVCNYLCTHPHVQQYWRHKVTDICRTADGKWTLRARYKQPGDQPDKALTYPGYDALLFADTMLTRPGSPGGIELDVAGKSHVVRQMQTVRALPTISLMVALPDTEGLQRIPFDLAEVVGSQAIKVISRNTSKPGRPHSNSKSCWTVLSTTEWAEHVLGDHEQLDAVANDMPGPHSIPRYALALLSEFQGLLKSAVQADLPKPAFAAVQRWGSAFKANPLHEPYLLDNSLNLAACGDFLMHGDARSAVQSGMGAASALHALLHPGQQSEC